MSLKQPVLTADKVCKSYESQEGGAPLEVLRDVSLALFESSVTSIIGTSGSGKSTLLHILGGLDRPDSGSITWGSARLERLNQNQLAGLRNSYLGFVFQFHHLLPEFSALENVCMPALISGMKYKEAVRLALPLMARLGVENRKEHRPAQLSGGEQQRVAMARALINKPKLILADEPTGNLDEANTETILSMLFELRDEFGVAILLITHEKGIAERSDRVLHLKNGRII